MKSLIRNLSVVLCLVFCLSCSNEGIENTSNIAPADLKIGVEMENWEEQVERLEQKMRRFHNFQVAQAQGWDVDGSGYVPGMGHHYLNQGLIDDQFEMLKPEALLYTPDEDGNWEFLAVEYLIVGPGPDDPAPDGFIGNADEWSFNHAINAWTLHVWIVKENPDGIFAATNPALP